MLLGHIPTEPAPPPVQTPTERQRTEQLAKLLTEQEKVAKRVQECKGRVERAKAKLQEEEASLELANREYEGASRQVEAHKAETSRLAKEAEIPRVEEVGSDMEVEGGTDTGKRLALILRRVRNGRL